MTAGHSSDSPLHAAHHVGADVQAAGNDLYAPSSPLQSQSLFLLSHMRKHIRPNQRQVFSAQRKVRCVPPPPDDGIQRRAALHCHRVDHWLARAGCR